VEEEGEGKGKDLQNIKNAILGVDTSQEVKKPVVLSDAPAAEKEVKPQVPLNVLGSVRVIEVEGKPEIVLEAEGIEVPVKGLDITQDEFSVHIRDKKKGKVMIELRDGMAEVHPSILDSLNVFSRPAEAAPKRERVVLTPPTKLRRYDESYASDVLKLEANLVDLRKEFASELEEAEQLDAEGKPKVKVEDLGLVERIVLKFMGKEKSVVPVKKWSVEKLKKFSMDNLSRVGQIEDKRTAIVGVGYVLKEFLQIRLGIPHELTYSELVGKIREMGMREETKQALLNFFMRLSNAAYSSDDNMEGLTEDNFPGIYDMAKNIVMEA